MWWLVLLIIWPLAELFVIIEISEWLGFVWMLLLLLASWPLGSWLIRNQGRAALQRLSAAITAGHVPASEVIDGALILCGGMLLMIPGFISDAFGLLLLIGPLRRPIGRFAGRHLGNGVMRRVVSFGGRGRGPDGVSVDYDVESTATVEGDDPQLRGRS